MSEASERALKREIHGKAHEVLVLPAPGWSDVLVREIESVLKSLCLPAKFQPHLTQQDDACLVQNIDFRNLIELPCRLQTAADIRWILRSRHVGSFGEFNTFLQQMPWELYVPNQARVQCKVESYRSKLFHEGKLAEQIEALLQAKGYACVNENPDIRLHFLQIENRHQLALSVTKDPLYHRHYKTQLRHRAPLQEHLAASALQWFFQLPQQKTWLPDLVYVPFAGSGTLWVETLLYRDHIPLNNWRSELGLEVWPAFPAASWGTLQKRLQALSTINSSSCPSLLLDLDPELVEQLKLQVHRIQSEGQLCFPQLSVTVQAGDFFERPWPESSVQPFIPINPPYGIRLEHAAADGESAKKFYVRLCQHLRSGLARFPGARGFVLVPDGDAYAGARESLGSEYTLGMQSFSQGGQHIRCLAFGRAT